MDSNCTGRQEILTLCRVVILVSGVLLSLSAVACSPSATFEVEGKALAPESWSTSECDVPERCAAIEAAATRQLEAREPGVEITQVRFHAPADGAVVASMEQVNVVFTLTDGGFRLESFACGPHGIVDASQAAYAEFCAEPN